MSRYRQPTRHDIGKTVEASWNGCDHWDRYILIGIWQSSNEARYHIRGGDINYAADYCRVPVINSDPIAELSAAADLLAEHGMDEAARVVMEAMTQ